MIETREQVLERILEKKKPRCPHCASTTEACADRRCRPLRAEQEAIKEAVKNGFAMLAECFVRKDGPSVLTILMDSSHPNRVRKKAAEMIGDIGEVEAIEPLRNAKFGNELVAELASVWRFARSGPKSWRLRLQDLKRRRSMTP